MWLYCFIYILLCLRDTIDWNQIPCTFLRIYLANKPNSDSESIVSNEMNESTADSACTGGLQQLFKMGHQPKSA